MLNEIKEFEEYQTEPLKRLKPQTTKNHFAGLKRALEILAIQYLYEFRFDNPEGDGIGETTEKLKVWVNNNYTKHVEGLVNTTDACDNSFADEANAHNKKTLLKSFEEKKKTFEVPVLFFSSNSKSKWADDIKADTKSDPNRITYERVIANALCTRGYQGLKRYYLVSDEDLLNMERIQVGNKSRERTNASETVIDVVSKITAAYLLKQKKVNDSTELCLTSADIFNWIVQGNYNQYFDKSSYYMKNASENSSVMIKIFEKNKVGNKKNSSVKYYFAPEWIKHFDVIEEKELNDWLKKNKDNPNKHYYRDDGAGKFLKRDKKYK